MCFRLPAPQQLSAETKQMKWIHMTLERLLRHFTGVEAAELNDVPFSFQIEYFFGSLISSPTVWRVFNMSWESSCAHSEAWSVLDCWFDKRRDFPSEGFWIHHRTSRLLVTTERCLTSVSRQFRLQLRIVFPVDEHCFCVFRSSSTRRD